MTNRLTKNAWSLEVLQTLELQSSMSQNEEQAKRDRIIQLVAEQLGVPEELVRERIGNWSDDIAIDPLDVPELVLEFQEQFGR